AGGGRSHVVAEQERIDEGEPGGGEGPTDDEAAALELAVGGDHAFDLATHGSSSLFSIVVLYRGSGGVLRGRRPRHLASDERHGATDQARGQGPQAPRLAGPG